jgi:hypothetical protein
LKLLNARQVKYLLVGGYAVGYHGYPRATADIDFWVAISQDNARKLTDLLREFGFNAPGLSESLFLEDNRIVRLGVPPFRIGIITTASGVEFLDCYTRRVEAVIDHVHVTLISLADLKVNKKAAGRLKDLADLDYLP